MLAELIATPGVEEIVAQRGRTGVMALHGGLEEQTADIAIEVAIPPPARCELQPEDIPLEVVHDDADIVVVNKPAGLVVHPAHGHPSGTLVNALLAGPLAPAPDDDPAKPGIVHRLDRDTSGLMVIARTAAARRNLQEQFRARTVDKTYLAVVEGSPPRVGTIDAAVGRDQRDRKRMAVRADGKPARSRYRVLERLPGASLVEVVIETGRTHQIRVHMRSLGHPLVGDKVYGHRRGGGGGPLLSFPRQALHAAGLRFRHPRTGVDMAFRAPLPEDILELLRALRGCGDEPSVV